MGVTVMVDADGAAAIKSPWAVVTQLMEDAVVLPAPNIDVPPAAPVPAAVVQRRNPEPTAEPASPPVRIVRRYSSSQNAAVIAVAPGKESAPEAPSAVPATAVPTAGFIVVVSDVVDVVTIPQAYSKKDSGA